jgi:cytidyltransferase-like protein
MKVIIVSGGFDPLHSGHILYFQDAKNRGDYLIVALNSDLWLKNKKGKAFIPLKREK